MPHTGTLSEDSERQLIFQGTARKLAGVGDPVVLMDLASACLHLLLPAAGDKLLLDQLSVTIGAIIGALPFHASPDELQKQTEQAAQRCLKVLQTAFDRAGPKTVNPPPAAARPAVSRPGPGGDRSPEAVPGSPVAVEDVRWEEFPQGVEDKEDRDLEYYLPPNLAHLLDHITYEIPQAVPSDKQCDSFDEWCCEAIIYRVNCVLAFFQRQNPALARQLAPPFLLSPQFAERFATAIRQLIFPTLNNSRQIRLLSSTVNYKQIDVNTFWTEVDAISRASLQMVWCTAWDALAPIEAKRGDGTVLQVKDATKKLRDILQPGSPADYDLPRVCAREIELFKTLLDPTADWAGRLNGVWTHIHLLYEQEMDPRVFQQQAREGAFRDYILSVLPQFPELWGDFIVLLCHRVFPRLSTGFLERFIRNFGTSPEKRQQHMPYLARYLAHAKANPEIKAQEEAEEAAWQLQVNELKSFLTGRESGPSGG